MVEADRTLEHAEVAGVVYSVLTNLHYEADDYFVELRLHMAIGMPEVEAGVHIHFVGIHDCYSHWRMREGRVVI